jgi:transcription elongation factor Elf1
LGRRRRRVVRIVKKKLPTVFVCPRCGEEAVRVTVAKDTGHATVLCALCNLKDEFPAHPAAQPIDVYSYFTDRFYGVKDPRPIIPHDREIQHVPTEEEPAEESALQPTSEQVVVTPQPKVETENQEMESPLATERTDESETRPTMESPPVEPTKVTGQEVSTEGQAEITEESKKESQEESEPFADILENKDKKRYSATPLPQQTSEQTS